MSATAPTVHGVDDDASFLTAISRLLRANGFSVKTYSSAHEFIMQRDADAPRCVLREITGTVGGGAYPTDAGGGHLPGPRLDLP